MIAMTREQRNAMRRFYALLRRARRAAWSAEMMVGGFIRITDPQGTCYCPLTCAYFLRTGKFVPVTKAGSTRHVLGLGFRIPFEGRMDNIIIRAADCEFAHLDDRSNLARSTRRIRRTFVRILNPHLEL